MCGIVGYVGPKNPKEIIFNGLKALEYRGYDSAGVCIFHDGGLKRIRAEGKLSVLEEKLEGEEFNGHIGIGHTRWATHGRPSERNAHPHNVKGVSIVHNGIIENYLQLREDVLSQGGVLESETDSELVAHLIAAEIDKGRDLFTAVLTVAPRLEGAYSILVVSEQFPGELIAFKSGPPLIVGLGENAFYIASDIQAIVSHTQKVIYLDDYEVAHIKDGHVQFYGLKGQPLKKTPVVLDWTVERAEKQGYPHFMLKEIFEQPRAVAAAIDPYIDVQSHTLDLGELRKENLKDLQRLYIVACGTSFYAGMAGKYFIESLSDVSVEVDIASEFRYRKMHLPEEALVIFISQSGETADTLAALRRVKEQGLKTVSVCNVKNSNIDRDADYHMYMNSGAEIGVASTKAFASSLALMQVMALGISKEKGLLSSEKETFYVKSLLAAPSLMENVLAYNRFFQEAAKDLKNYRGFLYMGRGVHYPIALEGALKLKELAYMHAEGYAAGEMKHGPLALIDPSMAIVMLAPKDELYEKTLSNLEESKARGGQIISIGTGEDERLKSLSKNYLAIPDPGSWMVNPLLEVIPLQLLAYHVACAFGHDVDQPRNLAKSVTVE
ncbi:MAG: glutamine--fructose-6-phosphate transaminase (isomerizing) [Bdellovibrio sp.]|nr:MAG: glutamine--fructose-6-phosphate transaminase (isomerizing) [Bdellovibrio sp.]